MCVMLQCSLKVSKLHSRSELKDEKILYGQCGLHCESKRRTVVENFLCKMRKEISNAKFVHRQTKN